MASKNFSFSHVATAPSPADSGTSLVVDAGEGARFGDTPFKAVVCPAGTRPLPSNAEVINVTNVSTDTFTIQRAQESSSARSIEVGDEIFAFKSAADLDRFVNGPASATDGAPALFDGTGGKTIKNSTPTGTGNPVLATSPTLVTPNLGTPSAGVLTNATGLPPAGRTGGFIIVTKTISATGTGSVTGAGFTPKMALMFKGNGTTTILRTGQVIYDGTSIYSFGGETSTAAHHSFTSTDWRYEDRTATVRFVAVPSGFTSDGFDYNATTVSGSHTWYIVLYG